MIEISDFKNQILNRYEHFKSIEKDETKLYNVQSERLQHLLLNAIRNVPVYKELGITEEQIKSNPYKALEEFPLITKQSILERYNDHVSDEIDVDTCFSTKTSGSTGVPFISIKDQVHLVQGMSNIMKILKDRGLEEGTRILRIAGRVNGLKEKTVEYGGVFRIAFIGINGPLELIDPKMIRQVVEYRPEVISGHGSEILLLYKLLEIHDLLEGLSKVRLIICGGESLSKSTRTFLEKAFQAQVVDCYGMQEIGDIAFQCPEYPEYYHINEESVYLELVGANGERLTEGEYGEFVATNLLNTTMPFIRYRTGDFGMISKEKCKCGRKTRVIKMIDGREMNPIELGNGDLLNPYVLKRQLEDIKVAQYQIVQDKPGQVRLNVVLGQNTTEQEVRDYVAKLHDWLGKETEIILRFCEIEDIISPNGKVKAFLCRVPQKLK
ncbi:hypothetical protein CI793_15195 [Anoxybacillus ayderensis]|uniref:phenylacetate--CoA ligase family protein n=1 Tax=Anoxybacillus sp. ST70 TaxID=2864180 RepID=UPI00109F9C11|nr:AMP-binding protein [Anoxybacillus sp. ST70]MBW9219731.1 AMP-binding protein [Anoxybacillus sp. ST70]THD14073.1 hypothetical protein CI793_15195 [Anoxybacillus ayderensis]